MVRKRTCELPFCHGLVEGTRNKRRCDRDRNIHLHQIISKNVKKIMRYIESHGEFTANDVTRELFKSKLDKNEKGSMYRLFQAMVREKYLSEHGKSDGLKVYVYSGGDDLRTVLLDEPSSEHAHSQSATASEIPFTNIEVLTGKLREFVHQKHGTWNHDDWLWITNRPDIRDLMESLRFKIEQLGQLLEDEKIRFWTRK